MGRGLEPWIPQTLWSHHCVRWPSTAELSESLGKEVLEEVARLQLGKSEMEQVPQGGSFPQVLGWGGQAPQPEQDARS